MNHGKNVLCEKPITINDKQLNELVLLSKKNKVFLMEAMWGIIFFTYSESKTMDIRRKNWKN